MTGEALITFVGTFTETQRDNLVEFFGNEDEQERDLVLEFLWALQEYKARVNDHLRS